MKNTAPSRAFRERGFTGAEPPRGQVGKREPINNVAIGRTIGNGEKRANYGRLHHRETACSHDRKSVRKPKKKVPTALPSEARATQGACVMARPRDGRRTPTRGTRAQEREQGGRPESDDTQKNEGEGKEGGMQAH